MQAAEFIMVVEQVIFLATSLAIRQQRAMKIFYYVFKYNFGYWVLTELNDKSIIQNDKRSCHYSNENCQIDNKSCHMEV